MSKDEHIERFAESFRLNGPSESLKQQILTSARSALSAPIGVKVHADSLVPYFAALAATLLMIVAVNAASNRAAKSSQSDYVVTIRACDRLQLNDELTANLPYRRSIALCIVSAGDARLKTYFSQLQNLLSQGASL